MSFVERDRPKKSRSYEPMSTQCVDPSKSMLSKVRLSHSNLFYVNPTLCLNLNMSMSAKQVQIQEIHFTSLYSIYPTFGSTLGTLNSPLQKHVSSISTTKRIPLHPLECLQVLARQKKNQGNLPSKLCCTLLKVSSCGQVLIKLRKLFNLALETFFKSLITFCIRRTIRSSSNYL